VERFRASDAADIRSAITNPMQNGARKIIDEATADVTIPPRTVDEVLIMNIPEASSLATENMSRQAMYAAKKRGQPVRDRDRVSTISPA
jgi:hypothetical protein